MAIKNYVEAIPSVGVNSAGVGAFQGFYPNGIPEACFMIRIINDSNTTVAISYDGIVGHEIVRANSDITLNFQTNALPKNGIAVLKKGQQVYYGGNPGVGTIYFVGYYQPGA